MIFSATSSVATKIPHALRRLAPIHAIADVYGIGPLLSLTGPFVGLHVLLAGIAHIAIGVGIYGAIGISKARHLACTSDYLLSLAVATIASVVTFFVYPEWRFDSSSGLGIQHRFLFSRRFRYVGLFPISRESDHSKYNSLKDFLQLELAIHLFRPFPSRASSVDPPNQNRRPNV